LENYKRRDKKYLNLIKNMAKREIMEIKIEKV
jgi:hypothetical protein